MIIPEIIPVQVLSICDNTSVGRWLIYVRSMHVHVYYILHGYVLYSSTQEMMVSVAQKQI